MKLNTVESIDIGNDCFTNVNEFVINGLNELKSLKIGKNSFTKGSGNSSRSFHLLDCNNLLLLDIGEYTFRNYGGIFELTTLPRLASIIIGDGCFMNVNKFVINGLNELKSIKIGMSSFTQLKSGDKWDDDKANNTNRSFHILNCVELKSIEIGQYSFSDYGGGFELKNLPKLSNIKIGRIGRDSSNFRYSSFVIKGIIDMIL